MFDIVTNRNADERNEVLFLGGNILKLMITLHPEVTMKGTYTFQGGASLTCLLLAHISTPHCLLQSTPSARRRVPSYMLSTLMQLAKQT
jgi:hypothetical protein